MAVPRILLCISSFLTALAWSASMRLPSYPLAVKTPYLSVWMPGHLSHDFPNSTPQFWNGQSLTWIVLARIDDVTYCLLGCTGGRPGTVQATQKSLNFTSTHTYVSLEAGSTEITLDFFSAVDPVDHVRQSLPYSYLTVSATNNEITHPKLDVLTAIDASWLSDRGTPFVESHTTNGFKYLSMNGEQGREFSENRQMALWGDVVLATKDDSDVSSSSCQVGSYPVIIGSFNQSGQLTGFMNTLDYDGLAACSQSVLSSKLNSSITFAIGLQQDKEIQYFDGTHTTNQAGYFRSQIPNVSEAVTHIFNDFEAALAQSRRLDQHIRSMGEVTSSKYADLLEFAVRQSFAGMQVTIPYDSLDTSHPYSFIKEISTDGNVNTLADLIPKALPIFHVLNPEYTRMFLEPVLRYSLKGWPLKHAVHDIGKRYPNATGETPCIEEFLPLDSTSVLLWMLHLYQNTTGDKELTELYAPILRRYADYCLQYGLFPVLQRSSVDAIGSAPNQTALSVSAAIALKAYGDMTGLSNYTDFGLAFAEKILDIGRDADQTHFLSHYTDEDDSWVLMYPLAFDAWLGVEAFPPWVHERQSTWYSNHSFPYGVQFRNNIRYTLVEWQMWVAATSSDHLRDDLVSAVHKFYNSETGPGTSVPGPSQWIVTPGEDEGKWTHFSKAKSNVGSIYMIAAVQQGFNSSFISNSRPQISITAAPVLEADALTVQDSNSVPVGHSREPSTSAIFTEFDIPYHVPDGASKPVDSSFLGLSFDTASFPKYMGDISERNDESRNLIHNLIVASDSTLTIRIGSPEGDYSIFDPIQATPIDWVNISGVPTLSIGPPFFNSIRALEALVRVEWIYQVPFAPFDITNAVQGAQSAVNAIPNGRLYALEIGHKSNLYAGVSRVENYNCRLYAAELFNFKMALKRGIGPIGNQFQALGLSHNEIDESWSMDECFEAGIKAQADLRSISVHYSQLSSNDELASSNVPRHAAIKREHEAIVRESNFLRDVYPCHPFIVSEASLVSTAAKDNHDIVGKMGHRSSFEIGLWNLDFLLYSMSQNISRVLMHQSCNSASSAWIPSSCQSPKSTSDDSTEVKAPYYALTFVASFVRTSQNFRVIPIQESEDTVVYAGYESGKLSKIAIVNYPPRDGTENISAAKKTVDLRVPSEVLHLRPKVRISPASLEAEVWSFDESMWNSPHLDQVPLEENTSPLYSLNDGTLSISLNGAEALLFEVLS